MNLYFRLLFTLIRCLWSAPIAPDQMLLVRRRVLPTYLDINFHMNSARYHGIAELAMLEFFIRTGVLRAMLKRAL